jgi:MFS superfamily sulfate permease-like transporter
VSLVLKLLSPAMTVALLGAIESLLSATVADRMAGTRHNPNVELMAQGVANIASPLVGGHDSRAHAAGRPAVRGAARGQGAAGPGTTVPEYAALYRIHGPFLFGATDKLARILDHIATLPPIVILRLRQRAAEVRAEKPKF